MSSALRAPAVEIREILRDRHVEARLAVGTGRLLVEGSTPVLVGAVVGRTRRALHDAGVDEIKLTDVAARLGGAAFELDADGRLLGVRPGRPRPGAWAPSSSGAPTSSRDSRRPSTGSWKTGRPATSSSSATPGSGRAASWRRSSKTCRPSFSRPRAPRTARASRSCLSVTWPIGPRRSTPTRRALGELESADSALSAARTLLEHFTASCPVVVVLDDLHWAVPDVPRSRGIRRPRRGGAPARGLRDPAGASRAAARLGRRRDGARRARR